MGIFTKFKKPLEAAEHVHFGHWALNAIEDAFSPLKLLFSVILGSGGGLIQFFQQGLSIWTVIAGLALFAIVLLIFILLSVYRVYKRREGSPLSVTKFDSDLKERATNNQLIADMTLSEMLSRISGVNQFVDLRKSEREKLDLAFKRIRDLGLQGALQVFGGPGLYETKPKDYPSMPREKIPSTFWRTHEIDQREFFDEGSDNIGMTVFQGGDLPSDDDYLGIWFNRAQVNAILGKPEPQKKYISLGDAAQRVYSHGRKNKWLIAKGAEELGGRGLSEANTPNDIIDYVGLFLLEQLPIYAKHIASTERELISDKDLRSTRTRDRCAVLTPLISEKPKFVEPEVTVDDLNDFIDREDANNKQK